MTLTQLLGSLGDVSLFGVMIFITMTAFIIVLAVLQFKRDQLDLRWLILEDLTGRPSLNKIGQILALCVSTWGFIVLILRDRMSTDYVTIYMVVWAGSSALSKFLDRKSNPMSISQTTNFEQTVNPANEPTATTRPDSNAPTVS